MHKILWLSGLGQTSNVSWDRPNSDLGRPKLSLDRRLGGQTSNLGRVEPINCLRPKKQFWPAMPVIHFLSNEAKYTLSYKILICPFSSLHVKINVCPGDDLQTFYPSEADG